MRERREMGNEEKSKGASHGGRKKGNRGSSIREGVHSFSHSFLSPCSLPGDVPDGEHEVHFLNRLLV